jgi:hypothetical protein
MADAGDGPVLLVGTRKGAWIVSADAARGSWSPEGRVFVNEEPTRDMHTPVVPGDEVTIMQALSGG